MYLPQTNKRGDYFQRFKTTYDGKKSSSVSIFRPPENISKPSKVCFRKNCLIGLETVLKEKRTSKVELMTAISDIQTHIKTNPVIEGVKNLSLKKIILFFVSHYSKIIVFREILETLIKETFCEVSKLKMNPMQMKASLEKRSLKVSTQICNQLQTGLKIGKLFVQEQPTQFHKNIQERMKDLKLMPPKPSQLNPDEKTEKIVFITKKKTSFVSENVSNKLKWKEFEKDSISNTQTNSIYREPENTEQIIERFRENIFLKENQFVSYKELYNNLNVCFCILQKKQNETKTRNTNYRQKISLVESKCKLQAKQAKKFEEKYIAQEKIIKYLKMEKFETVQLALKTHFQFQMQKKMNLGIADENRNNLLNFERYVKESSGWSNLLQQKTMAVEKIKAEKETIEREFVSLNKTTSKIMEKIGVVLGHVSKFGNEFKSKKEMAGSPSLKNIEVSNSSFASVNIKTELNQSIIKNEIRSTTGKIYVQKPTLFSKLFDEKNKIGEKEITENEEEFVQAEKIEKHASVLPEMVSFKEGDKRKHQKENRNSEKLKEVVQKFLVKLEIWLEEIIGNT